ncbi:MAG: hypothetical protein QM769_01285 [Pseudoxanthomonas sp.]
MKANRMLIALFIMLLATCYTGVLHASDPAQKLKQASYLFDQQRRSFPAERLIQEALAQYEETSDEIGLANAYLTYGFFFRSEAAELSRKTYEKYGFMDKTPYSERLSKSIEYFDRAKSIFEGRSDLPHVVHIEYNKAFTYKIMGDTAKACDAFDESVRASERASESDAGYNPALPDGFVSFSAFVSAQKDRVPCEP